ncbi:MAG TPA: hypothetical protein VFJ91_09740 [Gaiellaceae bacterium]|nr:hypothetical protein [Gaiellaceae bacterium]
MSPVSSASRPADADAAGAAPRRTALLVRRLDAAGSAAARRALADGWDVVALEGDEPGDRVTVLRPGALPGFEDGAFVAGCFDLVELGVEELLRRRPRVGAALVRLAGSADVDRYLCRALLRETGTLLGIALLVASPALAGYDRVVVEQHWPNGPDFAFLTRVARERRPPLPDDVADALARLEFQTEQAPAPLRALRSAVHAARELAALWRETLALVRPRGRALPRRPLLVRSYGEDWGLDRGGQPRLRNLDFAVDGETLAPAEVAVWLEDGVPADRRERLAERGYAVLSRADVAVGPAGALVRLLPGLLAASALFARLAGAERWWHEPVRHFVARTLLWREVARGARPRVFLALNDIHPTGVARTLALRRAGCLTVEYEFSSHWLTDERGWIPDYVYGFTVVDAMVSWGPLHSDHFRNHRGAFGEFWEVGCLWSEHARLVRDDAGLRGRYRAAIERSLGFPLAGFDAVVGVFDTSTASFFGHDDMAAFYAGVAAVARRLPRVLFLCKPKRPPETVFANARAGRELEAELAAAPNVAFLDQYFETAAAVAFSDLSINACFTSPAVETIGAGRPALYYDPTGLFPDSFFRRVPGLVATSEDELARRVQELLAAGDAEREADLRTRFAALEGHFDGRAITRLRERLRAALDAP